MIFFRLGQEVPLDENLKSLFDSVLDDLKIRDKEKKYYEPFTVGGFEVYHAGIPSGKFYAVIGLPINFTYKDAQSIETKDIRLGLDREILNIYHPAAENLLESLVLSEKAKKFAIAREVLMSQKSLPVYHCVESPAIFMGSVILAELARVNMNLSKRPFPLTVLTYGVSGLMGLMMLFQLRDATTTYFEKKVDKEIAELGPEYAEGGKEFYDSIIKRNVALRTLLGAHGTKLYKKDGDEIISIRQKRTPVSHRSRFFSDYLSADSAQEQPA